MISHDYYAELKNGIEKLNQIVKIILHIFEKKRPQKKPTLAVNFFNYEKKWEGTISITETPHITYDSSGRLIITPDQSFALGPKYV